MKKIRAKLFGLSLEEATFQRRGFPECEERLRLRLEEIGKTFLVGYLASLDTDSHEELRASLERVELERRGFAYEGAGMALALMDMLLPWRRDRWKSFVAGPGAPHNYMMIVGLGWALARMRRRVTRPLSKLDPLLGWLALDGYGFHEGYFKWKSVIVDHQVPSRLSGYARRVFDQGVGRSLWFVSGADVRRIADSISRFPESRHADIWAGVGLAAAYAGGIDEDSMRLLVELCGKHHPALAQGTVFACEARRQAGNIATHTALASRIICGMQVDDAADIAIAERRELSHDQVLPAYEIWRIRIQSHFVPAGREPNGTPSHLKTLDYHDPRSVSE